MIPCIFGTSKRRMFIAYYNDFYKEKRKRAWNI
jgi:hypothetical protein